MKFDKETVLKHHFWGLLCLAVPLALVGILVLLTAVSAEIRRNRKALEDALKSVESSGGSFKNDRWVEAMSKAARAKKDEEEIVWGKAYDVQASGFTWPVEFEQRFHFQDGFFPVEIKVYRKPPSGTTGKDEGTLHRLRGKISEQHDEYFVLSYEKKVGKKSVAMPPVTFYKTPEIANKISKKIKTDDGKELFFIELREGDWVDVTFEKGKYFGDLMTSTEQAAYKATYASQIDPILSQVQPVTANGRGVVQLRSWFYKPKELPPATAGFFRYVSKEWDLEGSDISEEAWIAQEDLWIQRELYRLIRMANDYVSIFKGDGDSDPKKSHTFTNPYWQLDLKLAGETKLDVKITNLLPRRQKLDVPFLIRLHDDKAGQEPVRIVIGGHEPLNPGESYRPTNGVDLSLTAAPTGIFGVEQEINWETAAIKRIDEISIGSANCHSDRTFPTGLRAFKEAAKKGGGQGGGKMPGGGQPGGGGAVPGGLPGGEGKEGGGKGGDDATTRHGLRATRYSLVTKQSRQLPVGLALIVDQEHIDRVLLAFTNSPLRFLTTQVIMNRYPRSLRPTLNQIAGRTGGDGGGAPAQSTTVKAPAGGGGFPPGGGAAFPKGGKGAETSVPTGETSESNMELVIYGIVTIYERYPPRKGS